MLLLIIYISVIIADFVLQDRKWLTAVNFFVMWIMMGWSFGNADYLNYLDRYDQLFQSRQEYLYSAFQRWAHGFGLDYQGFLIIMSLIFLLIRFFVILKMTSRQNLVLGMWLVFPFLMDIVQLRQFYGMSLVLLGIYFLFVHEHFPVVKFLICVGIAFFIQNSTAFYVLLLIPYALRNRGIGKKFEALFATVTGALFALFFTGILTRLWTKLNLSLAADEFGTSEVAAAGSLPVQYDWKMIRVYMFEVLLMFLLMAAANRFALMYAETAKDSLSDKQVSYINWCARVNWLLLSVLPVLILSKETYRLQHGFLIPFYIMLSYLRPEEKDPMKVERNIVSAGAASVLLLAAFVFLFEFSGKNLFEGVFKAAFWNNLVFSGLS